MEPLGSFFQPGQANDPDYVELRDVPDLAEARRFVEELWAEYEPFADRHFLADARNHLLQRLWEMYLGVTLMRKGFSLKKVSDEGPEFYFMAGEKRVWIEAVAPGPGTGADAVPESLPLQASIVPLRQIHLRLTNALAEKLKKYNAALKKGIVTVSDHYVVAISCRGIPDAVRAVDLPDVIRGYLPFGFPIVTIDLETRAIVNSSFQYRDQVTKSSGAPVSTRSFLDPKYAGISGVLCSRVCPTVHVEVEMGGDFEFLHNPLASQPIGKSVFSFCRQYFLEGQTLQTLEPKASPNRDTPVR